MITDYDNLEIRCPKLGHQIEFSYCRSVNDRLPCHMVFDCWFQQFDITEFISRHYSSEEVVAVMTTPKSKISSILEIVERVKAAELTK